MSALLWLLPALPLAGGAALLLAGHRADRAAPTTGAGLALATCALAAVAARTGPEAAAPFLPGLPVRLAVDGLSAPLAVTVAAVAALVLLAARAGLGPTDSAARFTGLMLLFTGAMLTTVTAATLPLLLMGWEVMGATSWALIGHTWRDRAATGAATTAFLTTRTGDLGLYAAAGAALAGGAAPSPSTTSPAPANPGAPSPPPASSWPRSASPPSSPSASGSPAPCAAPPPSPPSSTRPPWSPPGPTCCCAPARCWPPPAGAPN